MTEEARTTLTIGNLTFKAAETLADEMDEHPVCDALAVTLNETDEQAALWNVVAFFTDSGKAEAARNALKLQEAEIADLVQRDWVKESLKGLAPVAAGRFFLYGGHDRGRRRGGGISLLIDAGTAFGTGHHGTTEGCLLALDSILKRTRPRHMLDLGCGTGVLALAAAKATHTKVLASDIDPEAVRATKLNGAINSAGPLLACVTAPGLAHRLIAESQPFDLIFANILARPLVSLAPGLTRMVRPGGTLILSGLTNDQARWVLAAYRNRGLLPERRIVRGNWTTLVLGRKTIRRPALSRRTPAARATGPGWEEA